MWRKQKIAGRFFFCGGIITNRQTDLLKIDIEAWKVLSFVWHIHCVLFIVDLRKCRIMINEPVVSGDRQELCIHALFKKTQWIQLVYTLSAECVTCALAIFCKYLFLHVRQLFYLLRKSIRSTCYCDVYCQRFSSSH